MKVTAIYGAGGFGREVMAWLSVQNLCFFVDDSNDHWMSLEEFCTADVGEKHFVVAVADHEVRRKLVTECEIRGIAPTSAINPTAFIGDRVSIEPGAILCHGVIITCDAKIGKHFHANLCSYVAHDCAVGDYVTLAPRVSINGNCIIGDDVYIGTAATILPGVRIGSGAVVGAGAVVRSDVEPGTTVVGVPARRAK